MKVKVNMINTYCITMSEAVTMLSLMMMTSIVSEELLARDAQTDRQTDTHTHTRTHARTHGRMHVRTLAYTHTHTHTQRLGVVYLKLVQSRNKSKELDRER